MTTFAMSPTSVELPRHHAGFYGRPHSISQRSNSQFSDDEDAITPCPPQPTLNLQLPQHPENHTQGQYLGREQQPGQQRRPAVHRRDSWRSSMALHDHHDADVSPDAETEAVHVDAETLWRRMLTIQRMFGCYNSARMRAALDMDMDCGGDVGFIPSKTCLDLLNDSIDQLPEESRRRLEEFLEHGESGLTMRRKSWREKLLSRHGFR